MANHISAARPYAIAAYETAADSNALKSWSDILAVLAQVAEQPMVCSLFLNPHYSWDMLAALCIDFVGKGAQPCSEGQANFIRLLAKANKLSLLAEIKTLFDYFKSTVNETLDVTVTSAESLTEDYKAKLKIALKARFKRDAILTYKQDPSLLAGMLIQAGDKVIDGTVKTQLQRFTEALKVGTCN